MVLTYKLWRSGGLKRERTNSVDRAQWALGRGILEMIESRGWKIRRTRER